MKSNHLLTLVSALLGICGCPTRDKYDQMPSVLITSPTTSTTYTNGTVHITAAIDPPLDLPIVLSENGAPLKTLNPPTYNFDWNTTIVAEGPHVIVAEVSFSNDTVRSAAVTIVVDRIPPTVSLTPAPGTEDVVLRAPIQAAFSEPVVFSQPVAATFSLSNAGATVPTAVTVDSNNQTATIAIDDLTSLSLPALLAVSITATITDRAGNPLSNPANWSWSVPTWIILPTFRSNYAPAMTLGHDRFPVIAFAQPGVMGVSAIAVARYDGTGWNQTSPATGFGDLGSGEFSVAVDGQDHVLLAWSDYGTGGRFINVGKWDGASWDTSIPVLDGIPGSGTDATFPSMRVDHRDHPIISWIEGGDVFASRWTGSAWDSSWGRLGLSQATASELTLDADDNPIIAWRQQSSDQGGSAWTGSWVTDSLPASSQPPTIAVDSKQSPVTAIVAGSVIGVFRLTNGRWSQMTEQTLAIAAQDQNPRIVSDASGKPAVCWLRTGAGKLALARWTGSAWDTRAGEFTAGSPLPATTAPQMAIDAQGTIWLAWWDGSYVSTWMANY